MPHPTSIALDKLARLIGRPDPPVLIDVRTPEDYARDPRLVPSARCGPEQLEAGMTLYDAFYRWARDAVGETHDWRAGARAHG